jgi:phosphoribosylanthranilate isomerase
MTYIKICGIKNEEDALGAAEAGADFIGLMFASSTRQVTPEQAAKVTAALKKNRAKAESVGVFVNERIPTVRKTVETCRLDWVQLSGDESWEYCAELSLPFIKAIRLSSNERAESVKQQIDEGEKITGKQKHLIHLDTMVQDKYGGTGKTFDWTLAGPIVEKYQVMLAGGLNPGNVGRAIKLLKPWGVDVSTGVETKGVKDMKKVIKFIEAVREADASQ